MSYLTTGYFNWIGGAKGGPTMEGAVARDSQQHQAELGAMFRGGTANSSMNLWEDNRRVYMDNLRLWDCLTLIRSDPSMSCQSAINLVFSLRDSEYLVSFPDTHQLMLLRYPSGFVSHTNIHDAQLENMRLKDENSRLHAAIWVLRDNPNLQPDSTVAAIFRLQESQFQAKFHADPDVSRGGLFKFSDKQTYANNNKVYMASLDIGTEPNMAIQLTNKPIKADTTSSRRCRSASSRRPHSSYYSSMAQGALTRKRSGSSIHHRDMMSNWRSDRLLTSERMFFLPEEDIHAGLYTKRSPRLYKETGGPGHGHHWAADEDLEDFVQVRSDYNNSQTDENSLGELSPAQTIDRTISTKLPVEEFSKIIIWSDQRLGTTTWHDKSLKGKNTNFPVKSKAPQSQQTSKNNVHLPKLKEINHEQPKSSGEPFGLQRAITKKEILRNSNCNKLRFKNLHRVSVKSAVNYEMAKYNTNQNMKNDLPMLSMSANRETTKTHLNDLHQNTLINTNNISTLNFKSPHILPPVKPTSSEKPRPEMLKLMGKARSDLSDTHAHHEGSNELKDGSHFRNRPLTAKRRDFTRNRNDNLNSIAKWKAREALKKAENSSELKDCDQNVSRGTKKGASCNNSTVIKDASVRTIKYDDSISETYSRIIVKSFSVPQEYPTAVDKFSFQRSQDLLSLMNAQQPYIKYSETPTPFKPPLWQPYSFQGFTSVKHFLDRQRWLMDGQRMIRSDKTFFTRAISPSLFRINQEDVQTACCPKGKLPVPDIDYMQLHQKSFKVYHVFPRNAHSKEKEKSPNHEPAVEIGQLKGCDNIAVCKKKNQSLKVLYELGTWKYTKPLATMIKRNHCFKEHQKKK
ncbi:hypothetical protein BgiMline_022182 [Biomphalaria glabrata]|uniref:Uncharacterized protein n=1 Tax=Biomphalaria glabrata TaxID=6526 RepID=A0A2C9L3F8_BIOGL|nr:hypothetical protein BgiMline_010062 [Biomphalaria glabrata]